MKKKYLILTMFAFLGLFLNAQENLPDRPFYYYNGKRFYLDVDYSRISVISEGKVYQKKWTQNSFKCKN
jgi:hypothetical protein